MSLDPDSFAARLSFAKCVALWRVRGAEGPFLILVAASVLVLVMLSLEAPWMALVSAQAAWNQPPAAALAGAALAFALWWHGRAALQQILAARRSDWLAALPIAPVALRVPRLAWPLGTGLLLMPVGARPLAVLGFLVLLAALLLSSDLIAALCCRLAGDRGWLAALPLTPHRLLGGYAPTL